MWKKLVFVIVCMLLSVGFLARAEAQNQSAAMIVSSAQLPAGFDQAMHDRLVGLGFDVTIVPVGDVGSAFTIADADTYDLLLISESISSSGADPLIGTTAPVMHNESYGWDNWHFTTGANIHWVNGSSIDIVNNTHQIAAVAGVSIGPMAFFSAQASWTVDSVSALAPGAELIAQVNDSGTNCALIFAIETGAQLAGGATALNRAAGFSIPGDVSYSAGAMTPEAWALFDATVRWLTQAITPGLASGPRPVDTAEDVSRDIILSWTPGEYPMMRHNVYFSTSFDDVNDGVALVGPGQNANTYDPGRLEFDQRYFWRIDEVNATDGTVYTGAIWSFTVESFSYPISGEAITVTASSYQPGQVPENTVNGSGLVDDKHSNVVTDMWATNESETGPAWIEYEFDKIYKLDKMMVWNYNGESFLAGLGLNEVSIQHSADGITWTQLEGPFVFTKASGKAGYASDITVGFNEVPVKYVKIDITSNWFPVYPQYGLSEVRFLYVPTEARYPLPEDGATDVAMDVILGWRAGREAAGHNLYLDTDEQAVVSGTAFEANVSEASYGPLSLDLNSTYYWRVDEVNSAEIPDTWEGDVWNFTTREYLVVEDFESYNDIPEGQEGSNLVYLTWIDGYDNPAINGATIGYTSGSSLERSVTHGGSSQSVPITYDNSVAGISKVTASGAELQVGKDWTKGSPDTLVIWFYGDPNNAVTERMYAEINGKKVVYDGNAGDIAVSSWTMWDIGLEEFGVNLSNVTTFTIGFEKTAAIGGSGMIFVDDVRLYKNL
ncbi:MAG: discoidin domain-containing protein [Sedimentisphaerales bacterium]|nr:discoidin domain-containing protein [Sedimentisphaerales bacterium]